MDSTSSSSSSASIDVPSPGSLNVTNGVAHLSRVPALATVGAMPAFMSTNALPSNQTTRRFSFDRELETLEEEENHWPGQAYLLPVLTTQAAEPTLDELLRRVTEPSDFQNLDYIKLRVISFIVSLSRLSILLPRLVHLDLSGSVLHSLRDLGCNLFHLTRLNVANCGLSSFDGTSGFPGLQELIADDNMIQLVGPLADLVLLNHLSLRHNRIGDLATLTFLGMCPNLMELDLRGNPVTNFPLYQETLKRSVPSLERLDGEPLTMGSIEQQSILRTPPITHDERQDDQSITSLSSDALSTATSGAISEVLTHSLGDMSLHDSNSTSESLSLSIAPKRPATSCGVENTPNCPKDSLKPRAASASTISSSQRVHNRKGNNNGLLGAQTLAGSIVNVARQRRKKSRAEKISINSGSSLDIVYNSFSSSSSPAPPTSGSLWFRNDMNNLVFTQNTGRRLLPPLTTPPQLLPLDWIE